MARYIDVNKKIEELDMLIESINKLIKNRPYDEETKIMLREFTYCRNALIKAPTADVVEVVRCKECKHWFYWADEKRCSCELHYRNTKREDFCSYGERK